MGGGGATSRVPVVSTSVSRLVSTTIVRVAVTVAPAILAEEVCMFSVVTRVLVVAFGFLLVVAVFVFVDATVDKVETVFAAILFT